MTPLGRYVVETIVMLLAVAGLALLVLFAARRTGVGRPLGPLSLVGRLVLDARRAIYVVRIGDVFFVVGSSEAGLTKLGELGRDALPNLPVRNDDEPPRGFKDFLERFGSRQASAPARRSDES